MGTERYRLKSYSVQYETMTICEETFDKRVEKVRKTAHGMETNSDGGWQFEPKDRGGTVGGVVIGQHTCMTSVFTLFISRDAAIQPLENEEQVKADRFMYLGFHPAFLWGVDGLLN